MKHIMTIIILALLALAVLTGCETTKVIELSNGAYVNSTYNSQDMEDITGHSFVVLSNNLSYANEELGVGFSYTSAMAQLSCQGKICAVVTAPYTICLSYVTAKSTALYSENTDVEAMAEVEAQEFWNSVNQASFSYTSIFCYPANDENAQASYTAWSSQYANIEELCEYDDETYYFGSNVDYSGLDLTADEQSDLAKLVADTENFKNGICIFTKQVTTPKSSLNFSAKTLDGKTVTEDIFKDYALTMINIWATDCQPCIKEMPELEELYQKLPDNVNMVTLAVDGADDPDLVKEIYDSAGGTFMVIFPDSGLNRTLLSSVSATPTTVFVDSNGKLVGNPQVGTPAPSGSGQLVDAYLKLINERLK